MKHIFGEGFDDVSRVMFQHSSRITGEAPFLGKDGVIKVATSHRGVPKEYRKAQVHPGVYVNALQSCMSVCPIDVSNNECVVILTGGTPESVVAAIALGIKNVLYVAGDTNEFEMMQLPVASEEREHNVDYYAYSTNDMLSLSSVSLGLFA